MSRLALRVGGSKHDKGEVFSGSAKKSKESINNSKGCLKTRGSKKDKITIISKEQERIGNEAKEWTSEVRSSKKV